MRAWILLGTIAAAGLTALWAGGQSTTGLNDEAGLRRAAESYAAAMQAGAVGYLLKHTSAAEIVATLRRVAGGEHVLTPDLASRFLREFRARQPSAPRADLAQLSAREEEVLKLLATGETNRQIARRLFVSEETVKSHVAAIFRKLEVSDRTRAAVLAVKAGLVDP